jgi:hypothetical protein
VALSISRFLLFVSVAHGIQARATFASGDQSACTHRPDHSCLVAMGLGLVEVRRNSLGRITRKLEKCVLGTGGDATDNSSLRDFRMCHTSWGVAAFFSRLEGAERAAPCTLQARAARPFPFPILQLWSRRSYSWCADVVDPTLRRCFSVVLMPALQIPSKHTCAASAIRHDFALMANDWRFAAWGWILRSTGFHARTCPGIKRLNAERPANCTRKCMRRASFALRKNPSAP